MADDDAEAAELAAPWDDQTELFVDDIEGTVQKKFNLSFRKLLLSPDDFEGNKAVVGQIPNIKKEVNSYFDDLLGDLKDDQAQLEKDLDRIDQNSKKIEEVITSKASLARVPYIRPLTINYDPNRQEEVVIDQYNAGVDALVNKLLASSTYVANMSTAYKGHSIGSWVFSSQRQYILTVNPPVSAVITLENSRDVLNAMLDGVNERLGS